MSFRETKNPRLTRRGFLKLIGAMGAGTLAYMAGIESSDLDVVQMSLTLPRLDRAFSGFRMVQISDLHMGSWMNRERLAVVVDAVLAEKPDLVAITGDFVAGGRRESWYSDKLADLLAELARLSEEIPTVAVMGNHDHIAGVSLVRNMLAEANIVELPNTVFSIERGDSQLHFCGVDDVLYGDPNLVDLLYQVPESGAAILLAHEPDFADISASAKRFDLQISGHSHGGQVVLWDDFKPLLPRFGEKYPSGLYKVDEMLQYTNRGLGMSHVNVRFNCPPEMTVFTFYPAI